MCFEIISLSVIKSEFSYRFSNAVFLKAVTRSLPYGPTKLFEEIMRATILTLLITFTFFQSCEGQTKPTSKEFFNRDFKWKIQIPKGFESVPAEEWLKLQNRGADAIEKTYDAKVENKSTTIFVFVSDQLNYFESNYQTFDDKTYGSYLESFRDVNNILYGTFEAQMPNAILDSASSRETIDGRLFYTFQLVITIPDKIVMEFLMYSRLFGDREFTVNIMTVNKEKQRILLKAWRNSKFGTK